MWHEYFEDIFIHLYEEGLHSSESYMDDWSFLIANIYIGPWNTGLLMHEYIYFGRPNTYWTWWCSMIC